MTKKIEAEEFVSHGRRQLLAFGAAAIAGRVLAACGASTSTSNLGGGSSDAGAGESGAAVTGTDGGAWATGGTASMTAKSSYPNPFVTATPSTCTMTCELTQGPCWASGSAEREDISDGISGLPVRIALQLLDESCKPIAGAIVDVWHAAPSGKYSGNDTANEQVGFCTANDSDYTSHMYFRGHQTSDANGLVYFDTCFPGWYTSRAIHIHMTITVNGTASVTTQFCFDDALNASIFANEPVYVDRGQPDTKDTTDTVFSASTYQEYEFATARMEDGAMLAYKTIVLRSSTSETLCGGGSSGGPPGG